jgi:hypothetical protein
MKVPDRKTRAVRTASNAIMSEAAAVAGLAPKQSKAIKRLSVKLGRPPADIIDEAVKDLLAKYGQR